VPTEAPKAAPEAAKPAPTAPAPDLTKIIAREKAIRREQQKLDEARKSHAAELAELESIRAAKSTRDPLTIVRQLGYSPDELAEALLNAGKPATPEMEVRRLSRDLEEHKRSLADREAKAQAQAEAQRKASIDRETQEFRERTVRHVQANAEKYELIASNGLESAVPQKIEQHYRATFDPDTGRGELLSPDQAAEMVEKEIEERLAKAVATKKWQARVAASQSNAVQKPVASPQVRRSTIAELTGSTAAAVPPKGRTRAEREARAMAVLESGKPL
jgi:hypothetical protein